MIITRYPFTKITLLRLSKPEERERNGQTHKKGPSPTTFQSSATVREGDPRITYAYCSDWGGVHSRRRAFIASPAYDSKSRQWYYQVCANMDVLENGSQSSAAWGHKEQHCTCKEAPSSCCKNRVPRCLLRLQTSQFSGI